MVSRPPLKYDAFISYSHADDTRVAKALQDNLQRLAKRWDSLSAIRVFRDVTHLPITSLEPAIVDALDNSAFLLLLASPRSAASEWVTLELTRFLERHTPERVLIVLLDGDLAWDKELHRYVPGPKCAFPTVESFRLSYEPTFLDLRWASAESDLSLSNPRALDAAATIAATIQEIPKETLVGDLIEEHRRLRRNQRINLGFRGAAGFGIPAGVFFALAAAFSFTSDAVLSPTTGAYLYFTIGFAAIGAIAAFTCGLGWRGALAFAVGFLAFMPLYVIGSLRPFDSSIIDYCALTAISLAGFVVAGSIGASWSRWIRWTDGAKAFAAGGLVTALGWLVFGGFRPEGLHTALVSWLWVSERVWLAGKRALAVVAEVFNQRDTGMLIPFIGGVIAAGLVLGIRLANARTTPGIPAAPAEPNRLLVKLKALPVARALLGLFLVATGAWIVTLRNGHQAALAATVLSDGVFRDLLGSQVERTDNLGQGDALRLAIRARNALGRHGEYAAEHRLSTLIQQTTQSFAESTSRYFDRYKTPWKSPADVRDIAQILSEVGRPEELTRFLEVVRAHVNGIDAANAIEAARAEAAFGSKNLAADMLRSVRPTIAAQDWLARTLFARAFSEAGQPDTAARLFQRLNVDIAAQSPADLTSDDLDDAPLVVEIEDLVRRGQRDTAVALVSGNRHASALWHTQARFTRAAAQSRQYETAFAMLDALEEKEDPGWTTFDDRAEGLREIIIAARAHGDTAVIDTALARLRQTERIVRQREELNRFAGAKLATAFAVAGAFDEARNIANDLADEPWAAEIAIGMALSKAGRTSEASTILGHAWLSLQSHVVSASGTQPDQLADIGAALATAGRLAAARSVADDIPSGYGNSISKLSVYVAMLEYTTGIKQ